MTLVPCDRALCPSCGCPTEELTTDQPALIRHGGNGATERTSVALCPCCGWSLTFAVVEVNPRSVL